MDLMYAVLRKTCNRFPFYNDFMDADDELKGLIRISVKNAVAWVSQYDLNDMGDQSLGSRVFVCDLNMPWNYHKITTSENQITLLEWDLFGEALMVGDDSGNLSIWSYKEHLFNEWTCIGQVDLVGERIIAGTFFHSGRKVAINADKKDAVHYYDKFIRIRYKPSVCVAGGTAMDGCVLVTSTGLVIACIFQNDLNKPIVTCIECLSCTRSRISIVDIAHAMNGNLIVVTSCGSLRMPVKCYELSVSFTNRKTCSIVSRPLAGFILDSAVSSDLSSVSKLKFVVKDMINSLVVVANGKSTSVVQLWDLVADEFQTFAGTDESNGDVLKTLCWKFRNSYSTDSTVESICCVRTLMIHSPAAPTYISLLLKTNKIMVLSRNLNEEYCYSVTNFWDSKDLRRTLSNICLADIDISWMGNLMVCVDNVGNLYAIQVQNATGPLSISHAVTMLEYCWVSGFDFWDVAMSLKPQMLETVCERLTENFNRQPQHVQQHEYGAFLSMKTVLYRMSSNSAQKHSDLLSLLTLYSISVAFKSFVRPNDVSTYSDKGLGENLMPFLTETSPLDINTLIVNIEHKEYAVTKEFAVDPSVPMTFQQLIQWVAHLALNILGRVADHHKGGGYDIVNDNHALNILREVLVIIHIWSFMKSQCLPVFMKNGNFNGLTTLYRLISRLIQCNQSNEMDENFVDECYLLQNQVFYPIMTLNALEICDVASPAFFREQLPLQFTFGVEPDCAVFEIDSLPLDRCVQTIQNTDIIKHVYLGESSAYKMKQCNRCQGKTQIGSMNKSWARSWEDRWVRSCFCGGKWRFIKSAKSPYQIRRI